MRLRIRLDTISDASAFATIASGIDGRVFSLGCKDVWL